MRISWPGLKVVSVMVLFLLITACNSQSNASGTKTTSSAKNGVIKVSVVGIDAGNLNEARTLQMLIKDRLRKIKNIQLVDKNIEADYLLSVCPVVTGKINKALDIHYIAVSYTIVDYNTKDCVQNTALWDATELPQYVDNTVIPHFKEIVNR